ncbi:RNA polymerase sigma factor [Sandarakinorhabdus rubra]|uniref:RNA polymerase sigma factor n=1 Tax=Sandarakinorhabdus rubra TaxID=2672568 RepID=UPI0013DB678F|nr:sigma-70 family RNA polymerase sigma factor [Sandarakinorhabdus rubra]
MDVPAPGSGPSAPDTASLLLPRVAAGDAVAFTALVRLLERPARALAWRTLMDTAAAEDVCQQAFLRLWTHAARFDPARGSAEAWFRRILINLCLDRRRSIRPVQTIDDGFDMADPGPDPESQAIAADGRARLEAAMARLNPRQRLALGLFHGDGLSMAEIAEQMDTTAKAVEGLLGRARNELRTMLNETNT